MLIEVNVREHAAKSRTPDFIRETSSHFVGEAHGTSIRTTHWGQLRNWFLANKNRNIIKVVALCEEQPN